MNGGSKTGSVGSPRCTGSTNVGVPSTESSPRPGMELRSGGRVSPGRVAHSGSETGPDGGFGCWFTGGDGRGIGGAPGGASDGAGDAGTGRPEGGWFGAGAEWTTTVGSAGICGAVGSWKMGAAVGSWKMGAAVGSWRIGGAVGSWKMGGAVGSWKMGGAVGSWKMGGAGAAGADSAAAGGNWGSAGAL